jgi:hypothetical protein
MSWPWWVTQRSRRYGLPYEQLTHRQKTLRLLRLLNLARARGNRLTAKMALQELTKLDTRASLERGESAA